MANNNNPGKRFLGLAEGFSAGLKLSLFFLFSFVFLGYPVPLSIFLALVGGFAGAWVTAWIKSKDETVQPSQTQASEENTLETKATRPRKKKYTKNKNRPLSTSVLSWFGIHPNSSKSRRR